MNIEFTEEQKRTFLLTDAKNQTANLKALKLILEAEEDPIIQIRINNTLENAFSSVIKTDIIKIIDKEILEVQKAVDGKPNLWQ